MSKATGSSLPVPRFGKIDVNRLSTAIIMADAKGYNNLWNVNGGVAIGDTLSMEQSETDFYGLLTPQCAKE